MELGAPRAAARTGELKPKERSRSRRGLPHTNGAAAPLVAERAHCCAHATQCHASSSSSWGPQRQQLPIEALLHPRRHQQQGRRPRHQRESRVVLAPAAPGAGAPTITLHALPGDAEVPKLTPEELAMVEQLQALLEISDTKAPQATLTGQMGVQLITTSQAATAPSEHALLGPTDTLADEAEDGGGDGMAVGPSRGTSASPGPNPVGQVLAALATKVATSPAPGPSTATTSPVIQNPAAAASSNVVATAPAAPTTAGDADRLGGSSSGIAAASRSASGTSGASAGWPEAPMPREPTPSPPVPVPPPPSVLKGLNGGLSATPPTASSKSGASGGYSGVWGWGWSALQQLQARKVFAAMHGLAPSPPRPGAAAPGAGAAAGGGAGPAAGGAGPGAGAAAAGASAAAAAGAAKRQGMERGFDPMDTLDDEEDDSDSDSDDEASYGIEAGVPPPLAGGSSASMFAPSSPLGGASGGVPARINPSALWDRAVSSSASASKLASKVASKVASRVGGFSKAAAKKVAQSVTEPLATRVAQTSDAASAAVSAAQRSPLGKGAEVAGKAVAAAAAGAVAVAAASLPTPAVAAAAAAAKTARSAAAAAAANAASATASVAGAVAVARSAPARLLEELGANVANATGANALQGGPAKSSWVVVDAPPGSGIFPASMNPGGGSGGAGGAGATSAAPVRVVVISAAPEVARLVGRLQQQQSTTGLVSFESYKLGVKVPAAVYSEASSLYTTLLPLLLDFVAENKDGRICFTGMGAGGSLATVLGLMAASRGLRAHCMLPLVVAFNAPPVLAEVVPSALWGCGGSQQDECNAADFHDMVADVTARGLLTELGLPRDAVLNVLTKPPATSATAVPIGTSVSLSPSPSPSPPPPPVGAAGLSAGSLVAAAASKISSIVAGGSAATSPAPQPAAAAASAAGGVAMPAGASNGVGGGAHGALPGGAAGGSVVPLGASVDEDSFGAEAAHSGVPQAAGNGAAQGRAAAGASGNGAQRLGAGGKAASGVVGAGHKAGAAGTGQQQQQQQQVGQVVVEGNGGPSQLQLFKLVGEVRVQ